jgi:hypothetical protein
MTGAELLMALQDPAIRAGVQQALGLPSEPVAASLAELAAAQARTEGTVKELATEVKELATEVKELARSQVRVEAGLLAVRKELGALADNVGLGLEELAAIVLPDVLAQREGIHVVRFERRFMVTDAGEEEIDLFAEGERSGKPTPVVAEAKSRIYTGDVQKFSAKVGRIAAVLQAEPVGVMLGFLVHPKARELATGLGIQLVAMRSAA